MLLPQDVCIHCFSSCMLLPQMPTWLTVSSSPGLSVSVTFSGRPYLATQAKITTSLNSSHRPPLLSLSPEHLPPSIQYTTVLQCIYLPFVSAFSPEARLSEGGGLCLLCPLLELGLAQKRKVKIGLNKQFGNQYLRTQSKHCIAYLIFQKSSTISAVPLLKFTSGSLLGTK